MTESSIEVRNAVKIFGAQRALNDVSISFTRGEIHALAGLNGSGKSTFVKVLAGVHSLDAGAVLVDGAGAGELTPSKASELGLQFLHQDPVSFAHLTVTDNIAVGAGYTRSSHGRVDVKRERAWAAEVLARLGVDDISPRAQMGGLSQAQRTMVAIARAVQYQWSDRGVRLLVLDEPTASLPKHEVALVSDMVRRVAAEGVTVLFITHDLDMILDLADRVSVLRDGKLITTTDSSHLDKPQLASLMVGEEGVAEQSTAARRRPPSSSTALRAREVSGGRVDRVSLDVGTGEILGIAGLLGSGRSTLLSLLYGAQTRDGTVELNGRPLKPGNPRAARRAGVGFIPEDRRRHGSFPQMSMADNVTVASVRQYASPYWIPQRGERESALRTMEEFDVRPCDPDKPFRLFSGGNQQKSIIGRWARTSPALLLLDEPTQGVDVHARVQIHTAIKHLAEEGLSVIVVSSDFGELLELSDRILVMRRGRVRREVDPAAIKEDQLLHLAATDE
ncbi:sugar ABC transporter ATP-binding protein [Streptomyces sp. MNU89]|uniref:sugar ABC transporter ATP-binding protein n=1 Tax=Streptomyces sp. MNU89 TaxID=2560025 RepID=UPI001E298D2F|nr:sugar ABC transporter ATP-binding protein [Streptomyces sp. MNU89]MCC9738407.1 sugar ABC transporter ATP-binding protein [Streptomyces sp. MNU89]